MPNVTLMGLSPRLARRCYLMEVDLARQFKAMGSTHFAIRRGLMEARKMRRCYTRTRPRRR